MPRLSCPVCPATALAIPLLLGMLGVSAFQALTDNRTREDSGAPALDAAITTRATGVAAAQPDAGALLDGVEKSFVVVGYSTSYAWPEMLQHMLDEHSGGERIYHVHNAVIGGSPVERWIQPPESPTYERTFGAMLRDFFGPEARLRGDAPEPTIAICQQSLQLTGAQKGPVTAMHDKPGIAAGADALETLATMLRETGLERVYIAMHIYKEGYEPQVGNERLALWELLDRGHDFIFEGPDVWSPTLAAHPEAFTEDRLHPNERGMKIMAEAWYRAIAGVHAKQVVIDGLWEREYDINAMMRAYLAWRRGE